MISKPLGRVGAVSALIVMTSMPALAASSQPYDVVEQFAEVLSVVEDEYVEPPQRETLAQGAIAGMVGSLDPHSAYMTPEQYREFKQETSGKFAGIGVEVDLRDGQAGALQFDLELVTGGLVGALESKECRVHLRSPG